MKSYLLGPQVRAFMTILLALTLCVSVLGVLSVPSHAWSWMFAHRSRLLIPIFVNWLVVPLAFGVVLLINPYGRTFYRGKSVPDDHRRWSDRSAAVVGAYVLGSQLFETLATAAYWNRPLKQLAGAGLHGPSYLGLPDPNHLIGRFSLVAGGVLVAWFGNRVPKLLTPFRGGEPQRYDWTQMTRVVGWVWALGGLGLILWAILAPFTAESVRVLLAITAAMPVLSVGIWGAFRLGGPAANASPPRPR